MIYQLYNHIESKGLYHLRLNTAVQAIAPEIRLYTQHPKINHRWSFTGIYIYPHSVAGCSAMDGLWRSWVWRRRLRLCGAVARNLILSSLLAKPPLPILLDSRKPAENAYLKSEVRSLLSFGHGSIHRRRGPVHDHDCTNFGI